MAGIAMANGVNANQVRRWMRERGIEAPTRRLPMLKEMAPAFVPVPIAPATPESPAIRIEIRRGNAAIKINWLVSAAGDCAACLRNWMQ